MGTQKSFVMYHDYWELIEELTMQERGELLTAIYEYVQHKTQPNFTGELKIIFKKIRQDLERNAEKYQERCNQNRDNVNKRWKMQKEGENSNFDLPF